MPDPEVIIKWTVKPYSNILVIINLRVYTGFVINVMNLLVKLMPCIVPILKSINGSHPDTCPLLKSNHFHRYLTHKIDLGKIQ